jgi:hypothetical protein
VITGSITVEAGFNRNGLMAWQEDDNNHRTIYGHNARDEMTRIDCADSSFKTMMRDLCGNPYFVTDQNGSQVTTVYNDVDLPVSRSIVRAAGVGGPTVEGYGWDAARRCIQAWNNDTDVTQAFDSLGNCDLEGQTIPAFGTPKSVAKTFDPSSNKLTINDGTATTQYTIDACHRRSGVAVDAFPIAAYQFAGPGLRSPSLGYWNGTQMAATSDGFGREETRAWTSGPDTISSFINQYNDRHERTRETWSHYAGYYTDVTLDSVGRTIASKFKTDPVSGIPAEDCTYDLDGVCNREIVTTNGTPVTYIANQINSYTSIGGVTRVHDANGNLTPNYS